MNIFINKNQFFVIKSSFIKIKEMLTKLQGVSIKMIVNFEDFQIKLKTKLEKKILEQKLSG